MTKRRLSGTPHELHVAQANRRRVEHRAEEQPLKKLEFWKTHKTKQAMLVTGARQVGKTYLIREFAKQRYKHVAEFNLILDVDAREAFAGARSADDLALRIDIAAKEPLVPGETLIFIDEVQECPEIVTFIKGLVDKGDYDYILSGSLLGVELKGIRSAPVGYMSELHMYPLDFEEYCRAVGLSEKAFDVVRECVAQGSEVPDYVHRRLMDLFHRYLTVGGMPDVVGAQVADGNMDTVRRLQADIRSLYERDISKYAPQGRQLVIREIYRLIPSEPQSQSRRFKFSSIPRVKLYTQVENEFLWLVDADVALPAYNVVAPSFPLLMNKQRSTFKLFMSDVGLLMGTFAKQDALELYREAMAPRLGGAYENFVAQELTAKGCDLYYFAKRGIGKLDLLVQTATGEVVALEVKSGKGYRSHKAIDNALATPPTTASTVRTSWQKQTSRETTAYFTC